MAEEVEGVPVVAATLSLCRCRAFECSRPAASAHGGNMSPIFGGRTANCEDAAGASPWSNTSTSTAMAFGTWLSASLAVVGAASTRTLAPPRTRSSGHSRCSLLMASQLRWSQVDASASIRSSRISTMMASSMLSQGAMCQRWSTGSGALVTASSVVAKCCWIVRPRTRRSRCRQEI